MKFEDLELSPCILNHCKKIGFYTPTEIQEHSIPEIFKGKNLVIKSQTGSGKTMCFGFPILQNLYKDLYGIFD